eukprot:TRINITY_DN37411_c0_g1_i1.p1 TRINITY_DN37411_c0_g1~~TRINITY_DN37411_c0_g1_i1.p1  ORF type:complete len:263 (+),score=89.10 TRINITY_DN37411_c0_g1_i1:88-876(+)
MGDPRAVLGEMLLRRQQSGGGAAPAPGAADWERENRPGAGASFGEVRYAMEGSGRELVVEEAFQELGHRVWDCCVLMGRMLEHHTRPSGAGGDPRLDVRGKRVLELGAGTGLLSAVAVCAGAELAVATERQPLVPRMQSNLGAMLGADAGRAPCRALDWTDPDAVGAALEEHTAFDLVVGSDVCLVASAVPALLQVLRSLAERLPELTIIVGGARHREGWGALLRDAPAQGWQLDPIAEELLHPRYRSTKFEIVRMSLTPAS